MIQTSSFLVTKFSPEKSFGSTTDEFTLVKILNSLDTLASYPKEDSPYEILLDLCCYSTKGEIISFSRDIFLIHLSDKTLIDYLLSNFFLNFFLFFRFCCKALANFCFLSSLLDNEGIKTIDPDSLSRLK